MVKRNVEDEIEDLKKKFGTLLGYDFEAAVRLKDWETLRGIVEEVAQCTNKGISVFETITDILINSEAPNRIKLIIMQVILNYTVPSPMANVVKLSRWIRTLVQLSIAKNPKVTEALLVEVIDVTKSRGDGQKYPGEEIQWLTGRAKFPLIIFHVLEDSLTLYRKRLLGTGLLTSIGMYVCRFLCVSAGAKFRRLTQRGRQ